ncbi:MAG: lytic transglycosylase domain-containing protein [Alphaproteobacteria bacterium]|nr:lytic transglycosylase domain-containing protein [Alphaproteobacteria bacterium]
MIAWIAWAWAAPDAASMAKELAEVEAKLRDPGLAPDEVKRVGMRQQALYRALSGERDLQQAVLAGLDADTRWVVETNIGAGERIAHTVTNLKSTVPAWTIGVPPAVDTLLGYYREAEEKHGVPWEVLAAIHLVETRMGRLQGTSWAGAQGPMQFMPKTWEAYGQGDVTDPHDAILGAGNYLAKMGAAKDLDKAIWHYNHSDHYVRSVRAYASVLEKDPLAYRGYWGWQVFYRTQSGVVMLPEGYVQAEPVEVGAWCEANREHCPFLDAP